MYQSLLVSDLHLGEARPEVCAAFSEFCQTAARESDELYILGDLANAWVGVKDDSKTTTLIRNELSALTVEGVNIYVLIDDADLVKGYELSRICGVNLMRDPSFKQIEGNKTLLVHGAIMSMAETDFAAFVDQVENSQMQQMLQTKPVEERREMAVAIRAKNKRDDVTDHYKIDTVA